MTTLKQLKPLFNYAKKQTRPLLTRIVVDNVSIKITDLETTIRIQDNFGLKVGYHDINTLGLTKPIENIEDIKDYPYYLFDFKIDELYSLKISQETIQSFLPFCSKDETRIYLNGIAIVATNGHILKFEPLANKTDHSFIIPYTSLVILNTLLKKYKIKDDITMLFNEECLIINHEYFND